MGWLKKPLAPIGAEVGLAGLREIGNFRHLQLPAIAISVIHD